MTYIFYKSNTEDKVLCLHIDNENRIRQEIQNALRSILFVFNDEMNDIYIINPYFDILECSYFIYKLLDIHVKISEMKVDNSAPPYAITKVRSYRKRAV